MTEKELIRKMEIALKDIRENFRIMTIRLDRVESDLEELKNEVQKIL